MGWESQTDKLPKEMGPPELYLSDHCATANQLHGFNINNLIKLLICLIKSRIDPD